MTRNRLDLENYTCDRLERLASDLGSIPPKKRLPISRRLARNTIRLRRALIAIKLHPGTCALSKQLADKALFNVSTDGTKLNFCLRCMATKYGDSELCGVCAKEDQ